MAACSLSGGRHATDGPAERVRGAVPKAEPKSRYGNPKHYEVLGKRYHVMDSAAGYVEEGIASWYGKKFHGKRTSSGETYDMHAMTAAHKALPLPTYVEVTNLDNGKAIIVKVNDRGPFHENRIIDLSYAAAVELGLDKSGTGVVRVVAIDAGKRPAQKSAEAAKPAPRRSDDDSAGQRSSQRRAGRRAPVRVVPITTGDVRVTGASSGARRSGGSFQKGFFIQFGAFEDADNAERLKQRLSALQSRLLDIRRTRVNGKLFHQVRLGPLTRIDQADRIVDRSLQLGVREHRIVTD